MKKALGILLLAVLCLSLAGAVAEGERVFDRADLFTPSEETELNRQIAAFQKSTGMDFVIVTSDEEHGDASQVEIADQFYERGGFGLDADRSGVCYYIDMYERYHYISTTGAMIDYMTGDRIDAAIDRCTRYLSSGAYADGASAMIATVEGYVDQGIPEGQFRYDVVTGQMLTPSVHKVLTTGEIFGSAAIGLVICLIFVLIVQSRYKLKGSTYRYDYSDNGQVKLTDSADTYLRTTTTRTRKPDPPKNGGGFGGGGYGGGSGVHTSSSGTSHGGGGGHF